MDLNLLLLLLKVFIVSDCPHGRLRPSSPSVGVVLTDMIRISDMPPSQSNKYRTSMPPGVLSSVVVSTHKMLILDHCRHLVDVRNDALLLLLMLKKIHSPRAVSRGAKARLTAR
jgi:hypothetical protein